MSEEECDNQEDCIAFDKESLKIELLALTKAERMIIIEEYLRNAHQFGVGMKEFGEFMKWFDELED